MSGSKGMIFDIQKFSVHDGPGIRTTVFLKGCPLHCSWCHNPESWERTPVMAYYPERCIGCGACGSSCSQDAHMFSGHRHLFNRSRCSLCGVCADACPAGALEMIGTKMTVDDVMAVVKQDRNFYR